MKFSISIIDWIFGKKYEIDMGDGKKRFVTAKWLERARSLGLANEVHSEVIKVHILDPYAELPSMFNPEMEEPGYYRREYWIIGKDITADTVAKFKDPTTGDLYVMYTNINDGEGIKPLAMTRELWENARNEMDSI